MDDLATRQRPSIAVSLVPTSAGFIAFAIGVRCCRCPHYHEAVATILERLKAGCRRHVDCAHFRRHSIRQALDQYHFSNER